VEAVEPTIDASVAVVDLAGELDAGDTTWADQLHEALENGTRYLVVDLLDVTFIDSSVIQELLLASRRVGDLGWVRLVYTHHLIGRVVEICGLTDTFPHFTTVASALHNAPSKLGSATRTEGKRS
jgi:anti-anti-sigma factor